MAYTVVDNPAEYFNTKLYTGDGTGAKAITGVGFQPDLVWLKTRSTAFHHQLHDRVRGATAGAIYSSLTNAQDSNYPITSFDSDGFTLGNSASLIADSFASQNGSGTTMCSWNWLANGAGVSNTSGTISSTVSANTTSGFSVVTYTGNGTSGATFGHGLGVAPAFTIVKNRSTGGRNWQGFHKSLGNTKTHLLNSTEVPRTNAVFWNNTSPTSTLITLGNDADVNESGQTFIAYCFAEIKGYSKFGSYTGNGSTDGTFVYTGFKPAFVLQKNTSAVQGWQLQDNKRLGYNPDNYLLQPHTDQSESALQRIDILSNGFKVRTTDAGQNSSGAVYIYMCFAESPFTTSTGIPTTAR